MVGAYEENQEGATSHISEGAGAVNGYSDGSATSPGREGAVTQDAEEVRQRSQARDGHAKRDVGRLNSHLVLPVPPVPLRYPARCPRCAGHRSSAVPEWFSRSLLGAEEQESPLA